MATYRLEAFSTDQRSDDVRYRAYTTSKTKADRFGFIPKIRFSDSGHGIVFSSSEVRPGERRLPTILTLSRHVERCLAGLPEDENGDGLPRQIAAA